MKCPDCFVCEGCKKTYHRSVPKKLQMLEHEERKRTIPNYELYANEETVEVCDPCFRKIMRANANAD